MKLYKCSTYSGIIFIYIYPIHFMCKITIDMPVFVSTVRFEAAGIPSDPQGSRHGPLASTEPALQHAEQSQEAA